MHPHEPEFRCKSRNLVYDISIENFYNWMDAGKSELIFK